MSLELKKGLSVALPAELDFLTNESGMVRALLDSVSELLGIFKGYSSVIKAVACALEDVNGLSIPVEAAVSAIQSALDQLGNSSELAVQTIGIVESANIDQLIYNTFTAIDVKEELKKRFEGNVPSHIDLTLFDDHDFWEFEIANEINWLDITIQVDNAILNLNLDADIHAQVDGLDLGNLLLKAILDLEVARLAAESMNAIDLKGIISQKIVAAGDTVDWSQEFGSLVESINFKALYKQAVDAIDIREHINRIVDDLNVPRRVTDITGNSNIGEAVANAVQGIDLGSQVRNAIDHPIESIKWDRMLKSVDIGSALKSSVGSLPLPAKIAKPKISWITVHPYIEGIGTYSPVFKTYTLTPSQIYQAMETKLNSLNEAYSPPGEDSAVTGGIIGIGVANTVEEFITLVQSINQIMDISELQTLPDLVQIQVNPPIEPPPEPLWQDTKLESLLPVYGEAKQQVQAYLNSVSQAATGSCEAVSFLIKKLEKKLKTIERIKEILDNLSNVFADAQKMMDFYWGYIPPASGGVNKIKEALKTPPAVPDDTSKFCFGILGVGQAADIELFAKIFWPEN